MSSKVKIEVDGKNNVIVSGQDSPEIKVKQPAKTDLSSSDSASVNVTSINGDFTENITEEIDVENTDEGIGSALNKTYQSGTSVESVVRDVLTGLKAEPVVTIEVRLKDVSLPVDTEDLTTDAGLTPFRQNHNLPFENSFYLFGGIKFTFDDPDGAALDDEDLVIETNLLDTNPSLSLSDLGLSSWSELDGFKLGPEDSATSTYQGLLDYSFVPNSNTSDFYDQFVFVRPYETLISPPGHLDLSELDAQFYKEGFSDTEVDYVPSKTYTFTAKLKYKRADHLSVQEVSSNTSTVNLIKSVLVISEWPSPSNLIAFGGSTTYSRSNANQFSIYPSLNNQFAGQFLDEDPPFVGLRRVGFVSDNDEIEFSLPNSYTGRYLLGYGPPPNQLPEYSEVTTRTDVEGKITILVPVPYKIDLSIPSSIENESNFPCAGAFAFKKFVTKDFAVGATASVCKPFINTNGAGTAFTPTAIVYRLYETIQPGAFELGSQIHIRFVKDHPSPGDTS